MLSSTQIFWHDTQHTVTIADLILRSRWSNLLFIPLDLLELDKWADWNYSPLAAIKKKKKNVFSNLWALPYYWIFHFHFSPNFARIEIKLPWLKLRSSRVYKRHKTDVLYVMANHTALCSLQYFYKSCYVKRKYWWSFNRVRIHLNELPEEQNS